MDKIDQNVSRENIYEKILLLKELVRDLETDMNEHTDLKTQMNIYKSILPIRLRAHNYQNKADKWYPAIDAIKWDRIASRVPALRE